MNQAGIIYIIVFTLFLGACTKKSKIHPPHIIPKPQIISQKKGGFQLNKYVHIFASSPDLIPEAKFLANGIKEITGFRPEVSSQFASGSSIILRINSNIQSNEGYIIHSYKGKIEIEGKIRKGVFYGLQSFLQLIPMEHADEYQLPLIEIEDAPQFAWRGMHLDVSRHFFTTDFIKKIIGQMAQYKMNTFHWHLTDDQGWRIQIKKYPRLTQVGAWRNETKRGHMAEYPHQFDGKNHEGYYTQKEIRELVTYAEERNITIIPEISLPGHAQAAIAAYPYLGCFNQNVQVLPLWGLSKHVFCAGKESTFTFLQNVLSEVMELFPGSYIHIGGDECMKEHWEGCNLCQKRISTEKLNDEQELQNYFIKRIGSFIRTNGKKLIGWDHIMEGGLPYGATVMSWENGKKGIDAAELGHEVVMTPAEWCYFDSYQSHNPNEPLATDGLTTLEKVYSYKPIPGLLSTNKHHLILGTQANLWTEYITTEEQLEYMLFPRLCAISEVQWTNQNNKNFNDFEIRMESHYSRLAKQNVHFRLPSPAGIAPFHFYSTDTASIELASKVKSARIHFTLDKSDPNKSSPTYETPLQIPLSKDIVLKTISIHPNNSKSIIAQAILKKRILKPAQLSNFESGLLFKYYKGPFSSFKEVGGDAKIVGQANWLVLTEETKVPQSGWIYEGFIQIDQSGIYTFELNSECGSGLYIAEELIIDHDGFFYPRGKQATVELEAGFYPIRVNYFNSIYSQTLKLNYKPPGGNEMLVFPGKKYLRTSQ